MSETKLSLAAEAYLYGYPLVYCVDEIVNAASVKAKMSTAAPVNVFMIVGRYATTGGDDLARVWPLQNDTWLTPLSRYPSKPDN